MKYVRLNRSIALMLTLVLLSSICFAALAETLTNNSMPAAANGEGATAEATLSPFATLPIPTTTVEPTVTEEPTATEVPAATEAPAATEVPATTEEPAATETPAATEEPVATETPEATEIPVTTEEPMATEEPVATEEPMATEEPVATEEPMVTEEPAATEVPAFESGYAYAASGMQLYTSRSQTAESLLLTTTADGYVYVLETYGEESDWAKICLACQVGEETLLVEGYAQHLYLTLTSVEEQPSIADSIVAGPHHWFGDVPLTIVSAQAPVTEEPEATPEPTPMPEPTVHIIIHANDVIYEGDTVTLEAVAEGFDHTPVYSWEYQVPGDETWHTCQGANGSTFSFVVNQYNSLFHWRVNAE